MHSKGDMTGAPLTVQTAIRDRIGMLEMQGELLLKLERASEAEEVYR